MEDGKAYSERSKPIENASVRIQCKRAILVGEDPSIRTIRKQGDLTLRKTSKNYCSNI